MSKANVLPDNLQAEFDNFQQKIAAYEKKTEELHQALNGTNEEITTLRHALSGKEETIHNLKSELNWARRQLYGPKRESLPKEQPENQLGLFGEKRPEDDIDVDGVEDADLQIAETSQGTKAGDDVPKSPPSITAINRPFVGRIEKTQRSQAHFFKHRDPRDSHTRS